MAEPTQYTFSYKEVVEALIKQQDLHEGEWAIFVEFGIHSFSTTSLTDRQIRGYLARATLALPPWEVHTRFRIGESMLFPGCPLQKLGAVPEQ